MLTHRQNVVSNCLAASPLSPHRPTDAILTWLPLFFSTHIYPARAYRRFPRHASVRRRRPWPSAQSRPRHSSITFADHIQPPPLPPPFLPPPSYEKVCDRSSATAEHISLARTGQAPPAQFFRGPRIDTNVVSAGHRRLGPYDRAGLHDAACCSSRANGG